MKKIPEKSPTDEMLLWMIFTKELISMNKKDAERLVKYILRLIHKFHKICENREHYKYKVSLYRKEKVGFYFEEISNPSHSYVLKTGRFILDKINLPNSSGFNEALNFLFKMNYYKTESGLLGMDKKVHKEGFSSFCYDLIIRNYPQYARE